MKLKIYFWPFPAFDQNEIIKTVSLSLSFDKYKKIKLIFLNILYFFHRIIRKLI